MKVQYRNPDMSECPTSVEPFARGQELNPSSEYGVLAVAVYDGVVLFLVIDDLDYPSWAPAWLFRTTDTSIPSDWIGNSFTDWPELLLGPDFIASSQADYQKMVELERGKVALLRERRIG